MSLRGCSINSWPQSSHSLSRKCSELNCFICGVTTNTIFNLVFIPTETSKATDKTSAELELMYFIKRNNICISDVPKWKSSIELDPRSSVVVQYFFSFSFFFILLCVPFFKLKQSINKWHIKLMIRSETHTKCTSAFL